MLGFPADMARQNAYTRITSEDEKLLEHVFEAIRKQSEEGFFEVDVDDCPLSKLAVCTLRDYGYHVSAKVFSNSSWIHTISWELKSSIL